MSLGSTQIDPGFWPRFELKGRLGEGAMGLVYRARDRLLGADVALKVLRDVEGLTLFHFKREFRALQRLCHPNLVSLYELHAGTAEDPRWYLTMELIEGLDFHSYVRPDRILPARVHDTIFEQERTGVPTVAPVERIDPDSERSLAATELELPKLYDEGRLRRCLGQLARGIEALHVAGRLHRDLKPSNVLVTKSGRVVLLDFGLVAMLGPDQQHESTVARIVGTAGYMSPEQSRGGLIGPASDWYAFGTMLYEALTGQRPFLGSVAEVIQKRLRDEARPAQRLSPAVPDDLDQLCTELLRRDPTARPNGPEILRRLGAGPGLDPLPNLVLGDAAPSLVGRDAELLRLRAAFAQAESGVPTAVLLRGSSGVGKTALLDHFLRSLGALGPALVLRGACSEREVVPYKAFDAVVDELSSFLRPLDPAALAELLPKDVSALAQLFVVLRQVPTLLPAPGDGPVQVLDPRELRTRAFRAFRQLLRSLGRDRTLVVAIDDLQWGDADSAALLLELLQGGDSIRLLLLGAHRLEDERSSPMLAALSRLRPGARSVVERLDLGLLAAEQIEALARQRLPAEAEAAVQAVVRHAQGLPYFASELIAAWERAGAGAAPPNLDEALKSRVAGLPGPAGLLLEILAVAGRPLPESVLLGAAELGAGGPVALRLLLSQQLVRSRATGRIEEDEILYYHPRIREVVRSGLSERRVMGHHQALAEAIQASGPRDVESLAMHFYAGGERDQARAMALLAASRAEEALAFARAALFLEMAHDLAPPEARPELLLRLARILALAGRGAEAADRYLALAEQGPAPEAAGLRQQAAELLLRAGHSDRGRALLATLVAEEGQSVPDSGWARTASLWWRRAQVQLRGLAFQRSEEATLSPAAVARVDRAWGLSTGLALVDSTLGADYQARHLLLALRLGEPFRVVRALAIEASFRATAGAGERRRSATILAEAERLAAPLARPEAQALVAMARGATAVLEGRFSEGRLATREAEATFRARCLGVSWEIATCQVFHVMASALSGQLGALLRFVTRNVQEAEDRGDRYALANLRSGHGNLAFLVEDGSAEAERALDETTPHLPGGAFALPHLYELLARTQLDLYRGRGEAAWQRLRARRAVAERSVGVRVELLRIELAFAIGRAALAGGRGLGDDRRQEAERSAAQLAREKAPWARPLSRLLRAGVAEQQGRVAEAVALLATAIAEFDQQEMAWHAAAARWRRGQLLGGSAGAALVAEGLAYGQRHGVTRPDALLGLLVGSLDARL